MGRFSDQIKKITKDSNNTKDLTEVENKSLESLEPSSRVVFFGGYEGSDIQIPYSYYELQNIFGKEVIKEESVRFIHEAKKYGDIKFVKEIKNVQEEK